LNWLFVFLDDVALLQSELSGETELVIEDGALAQVHIGRLDHPEGRELGRIEG
jgi:hypothetical protein